MKIFLTGAAGLMGTDLREKLGYDFVGYDKQWGQDILDADQLHEEMQGCEMVVHAAAIPHPNEELGFKPFFDVNVRGTVNVLDVAAELGVRRFIHVSSTAFYLINMRTYDDKTSKSKGLCNMDPVITESHPTQLGRTPDRFDAYDISKLMDEAACAWYGTNTPMEVLTLRFGPCVKERGYTRNPKRDNTWRTRSLFGWTHPDSVVLGVKCAIDFNGSVNYMPFVMVDERPSGAPDGPEWDTTRAQDVLGWKPKTTRSSLQGGRGPVRSLLTMPHVELESLTGSESPTKAKQETTSTSGQSQE